MVSISKLPAIKTVICIHIFLLTMCFEALRDIKELSVKQICTAFGISSVFFIYADANMTENYDFLIILGTAAFAFAYMLFMIIYKQNRKKSAVAFVAFLLLCAELTINIYDSIKLGAASRSGYLLDNNRWRQMWRILRKMTRTNSTGLKKRSRMAFKG